MKYFTKELMEKLSDFHSPHYKEYENEWNSNLKQYWIYFDSIQKLFSKIFVREYKNHAFHDNVVKYAKFERSAIENKNDYVIMLEDDDKLSYELKYIDVSSISFNYNISKYRRNLTWVYSELEYKDDLFSHEILFIEDNYLYIEF